MPTTPADARRRAIVNSRLFCAFPRCPNRRAWVAQHCSFHKEMQVRYGHPAARPLRSFDLEPWRKLARRLLKANADNEGVREALALVERQCIAPTKLPEPGGPRYHNARKLLHRELLRLQQPRPVWKKSRGNAGLAKYTPKPVTAVEILVECLAVFAHVLGNPRALPNDGRCLDYALGNCVFRLRQFDCLFTWEGNVQKRIKPRYPGGHATSSLGTALRQSLVPFVARAVPVLEQMAQDRERAKLAMRTPLVTP